MYFFKNKNDMGFDVQINKTACILTLPKFIKLLKKTCVFG